MKKLLMIFSICAMAMSTAFGQDDQYYNGDEATVTVKAEVAPPALPDYVQPPCPGDGYLWTPGYWAWGGTGYYWVPGVWVMPPSVGLLWTPGYWGFYGGYYGWHHGYWGDHVGYYGGVHYGFGYEGVGFYGGRWEGGHFRYNTAVWHVNHNIHNTYVEAHPINHEGGRASFNGPSGVHYRPGGPEQNTIRENHVQRTTEQVNHHENAGHDQRQFVGPSHAQPAYHSMNTTGGQHFNSAGHSVNMGGGHSGGGGHPSGGGGGHSGGGGHGGGGRR